MQTKKIPIKVENIWKFYKDGKLIKTEIYKRDTFLISNYEDLVTDLYINDNINLTQI